MGGGSGRTPPTLVTYGPQDLSNSVVKLFKKDASPYMREFEGRGPKHFLPHPQ